MITSSIRMTLWLLLALFLVLVSFGPAIGATYWQTAGEGDWGDLVNWLPSVPDAGTDAFINNGGTAKIVNADAAARNLTLGSGALDSGTAKLMNNYQLTVGQTLILGSYGQGSFYQQDGAVKALGLRLGNQSGATGSFYLEKGNLTVGDESAGSMNVGFFGTGLFQQTGGAVSVWNISLGEHTGSLGHYILEDGSLNMPKGYMYIGKNGPGSFEQKGGTVSATAIMSLGVFAGVQGDYTLKNGTLTVGETGKPKALDVGDRGIGNFFQENGAVTIYGSLNVGLGDGGEGNYFFKGGSLTLQETGGSDAALSVGYSGKGYFEQNGSVVTVNNRLFIGRIAGAEGTYSLLNGTLNVGSESTPGPMYVGSVGKGEFQQISGDVTVTRELTLGWQTGSEGKYLLKDGTLKVGTSSLTALVIGSYGAGSFEQQGGAVTAYSTMQVGYHNTIVPESQGTYSMLGGTLTVGQKETPADLYVGHVGGSGSGTFLQQAGTTTVYGKLHVGASGIFNQTGGTFASASADNQGQMTFDGSRGVPLTANLGDMTNQGAIKVTNTSVTFTNYRESGSYTSDPATTIVLGNLVIEPTGFLVGGNGDLWKIGNNFLNTSMQNTAWNTSQATLAFFQSEGQDTLHTLQIPGVDKDQSYAGYSSNFAWGILDVTGQELSVLDYGEAGGALYLRALAGLLFDDEDPLHILNIDSPSGLNLYYDPNFSPELHGLTYALDGGGLLRPVVPLPGSVWLMLSGLAGLAALRRWRN